MKHGVMVAKAEIYGNVAIVRIAKDASMTPGEARASANSLLRAADAAEQHNKKMVSKMFDESAGVAKCLVQS